MKRHRSSVTVTIIQGDSKLSGFLFIRHGKPDYHLESLYIITSCLTLSSLLVIFKMIDFGRWVHFRCQA
jgi:hypothetical protein